jgi:two-component system chemotaxis sensor kinase CheA
MNIDLNEVVALFLEESAENLAVMEQALIELESRPRDDEIVGALFRAAHTIKGNASSLGFLATAELTHVLEDVLDDLRKGRRAADPPLVSALLEAVDALRRMIPREAAGSAEPGGEDGALLGRLRELARGPSAALPDETQAQPHPDHRPPDAGRDRTLRVNLGTLDRMLTLTGEIAIAQGRMKQILGRPGERRDEALEAHLDTERLCQDLQELVLKARMVPLGPVFRQHARTVRDVAAAQGKLARLVIEGEDVEVDTSVVEHIRDPLTHLVRNALDHGVEPPDVRRRLGKDPCACVTLRACHRAGSVLIELTDDGGGLDRRRIVARARERGLAPHAEALGDAELHRLVFEPGFSTAEAVTELSGRGIGLDVVRRSVESLRGNVGIDSVEGRGTTVTMRFPLTLAIIGGLLVEVGDQTFVVPLDGVAECVEMPPDPGPEVEGRGVLDVRGETLPYVHLRELFGIGGGRPRRQQVVVVRCGEAQAGLVVDAVEGESQSVIKPLGRLFRGLRWIAGSTILGSGRVAMILDLPTLLDALRPAGRPAAGPPRVVPGRARPEPRG